MAVSDKFMPGSVADSVEIFSYPFFNEEESKEFIKDHGRIMFIIRGPPGTGKRSLTELIIKHFPSGTRCSADDYFSNTFNSSARTKESLKKSHFYCHRRVKQECVKNAHPIIVSNTHMKKKEFQEYLNLAMEYEYTVIIASTLDKFEVSPEILARSNTKGLDENYFRKRLRDWQDVFPNLMGWFLCENDSFFVLQQLQFALGALLGDGRFCRVFDAFDSDSLLSQYKAKKVLCCVAGFMKSHPFELKKYYKSKEVRDSYGKCFRISIQAFVVTKTDIFAIIQLDDNLKKLTLRSNFEIYYNADKSCNDNDDLNNVIDSIQSLSVRNSYNFKLIPLNNDFSLKSKSAELTEKTTDYLNTREISFIHLAQKEEKSFSAWDLNTLLQKSFSDIVEPNGELKKDQFTELENGYVICRLQNDGWIITLPKILSVKTVFTGLYM